MRQSRCAVLITLVTVGLTAWLSPDTSALEPMDVPTASQESSLAQAPTLSPSAVGHYLIMAQNTEQRKAVKNEKNPADKTEKTKREKPEKPSSDRMANYQCLEYCVVVRQSCEGLATIQPDVKKATIGSKENNEWSRECQKIYYNCQNKCNTDGKKVSWERSKNAIIKNQKKGESSRER